MKRVFRKKSLVEAPSQGLTMEVLGLPGGFRQQVNTPVTMLGIALSVGASASLVSVPGSALAAEGSAVVILPTTSDTVQEPTLALPTGDSAATTYYTVNDGDSLWQIALQHQADVVTIKAANGISQDDVLRAGQVLRLPSADLSNTAGFESATSPRFDVSSEALIGGVGGDIPTLSIDSPAVTTLALDQFEANLDDLAANAPELDEELDIAEYDEKLDLEAASEVAPSSEWESVSALAPQQSPSSESATATAPAEPAEAAAVEAVPSTPLASASLSHDWQDATALSPELTEAPVTEESGQMVAAAPPEQSSRPVATATPEAPVEDEVSEAEPTNALPMSLALHETPRQPRIPSGLASRPEPAAQAEVATPSTVANSALSVVEGGVSLDPVALDREESSVSLDVASATNLAPAAEPTTEVANVPTRSREEVIQDHLARIRESNGAAVDREALNERIRQARQELERSRNGVSDFINPNSDTTRSQGSPSLARAGQEEPIATVPETTASATPNPARAGSEESTPTISLPFERSTQARRPQTWTVTDGSAEAETPTADDRTTTLDTANEAIAETATLSRASEVMEPAAPREVSLPNLDGSQLMAAAPLGPDAYRPFPSVPTGQMVSPDMPMLPGSEEFLPEAPARFNGYVWPARGVFTSGYGWRWGRMHRGIDIAGPVGTPIVAAANGTVVRSGWNSGGYGNMVDIRHPDGSLTRYAHNSRNLVREGEQVRQGQQIAEMGSTGFSTGPHLHFEIHLPGTGTVNPMAHLPRR